MFFKQVRALLIVLAAISAPFVSNAEESAQDGLQRCSLLNNSSARLACYDKLSGRASSADAKVIDVPALPNNNQASELMTVPNAQQPKPKNERHKEPTSEIVSVTKCSKSGGNKKYTFYLENGQVWKQISDKRLHFKDCNFGVTIHKDFFGFKMQLEDTKKKFRVSRVR